MYKTTPSTFQDAVSAIGGVIGAINIPERWFPGAVDMYLNSHNIMHVLVVTAVYFMHQVSIVTSTWPWNFKLCHLLDNY